MPTLEEYDSDPEDMPLDEVVAPAPSPAAVAPRKAKGNAVPRSSTTSTTTSSTAGTGPTGQMVPGISGVPANLMGRTPYKAMQKSDYEGWETIYPIYIDGKRAQQAGQRRVNKEIALEWPIAEQMAHACSMLGIESVYEPSRTHPKDWANPGRVKVLLKQDGQAKNSAIKNKRILLQRVCEILQQYAPKPPAPTAKNPHPKLPITKRLPPNSPAISHGVLESALKGGGMGGMLGNLLGGGGAAGEEETKEEEPVAKKAVKNVPKPKKVHVRRR